MNAVYKGFAVACLHLMIVAGVGGKFLYDRAHRPRVWVKTGAVDPVTPIRGRYMALRLEVQAPWFAQDRLKQKKDPYWSWVTLAVENGALVARESDVDTGLVIRTQTVYPIIRNQQANQSTAPASDVQFLDENVLFFVPEHADLPRLKQGEELWAEVTVPRKGPPRPIQLAVKRGTEWKPLSYQ